MPLHYLTALKLNYKPKSVALSRYQVGRSWPSCMDRDYVVIMIFKFRRKRIAVPVLIFITARFRNIMFLLIFHFAILSLTFARPAIDARDDLVFSSGSQTSSNDFLWDSPAADLGLATEDASPGTLDAANMGAFFDGPIIDYLDPTGDSFASARSTGEWPLLDLASSCSTEQELMLGKVRRGDQCTAKDALEDPKESSVNSLPRLFWVSSSWLLTLKLTRLGTTRRGTTRSNHSHYLYLHRYLVCHMEIYAHRTKCRGKCLCAVMTTHFNSL